MSKKFTKQEILDFHNDEMDIMMSRVKKYQKEYHKACLLIGELMLEEYDDILETRILDLKIINEDIEI